MKVLEGYFMMFVSPSALILLAVFLLLFLQNIRETRIRQLLLGESEDSPLAFTLSQLFFSLAGGLALSGLAAYFGITFQAYGPIQVIFLFTLFSLTPYFVQTHVGIFALFVPALAFLLDPAGRVLEDLGRLYLLVALTFVVQGALLVADPFRGYLPVLFRRGKEIHGGFRLAKTYALPAVFAYGAASGSILGVSLFYLATLQVFTLKESVMTFKPKEASYILGGFRMASGFCLLVLLLLSGLFSPVVYVVPLAGAGLPLLESRLFRLWENQRTFPFISDKTSLSVLDVRGKTPAHEAGLRTGQVIVSINGQEPRYSTLVSYLQRAAHTRTLSLGVKDPRKGEMKITFTILPEAGTGILVVPPAEYLATAEKDA